MSTEKICRVCLANNLSLHDVRKDMQDIFEKLTGKTYNKVGYPATMCYICMSVLRKCLRFMETAQDSHKILKKWIKQENQDNVLKAQHLYTLTVEKTAVLEINMTNNLPVESRKNCNGEDNSQHNQDEEGEMCDNNNINNISPHMYYDLYKKYKSNTVIFVSDNTLDFSDMRHNENANSELENTSTVVDRITGESNNVSCYENSNGHLKTSTDTDKSIGDVQNESTHTKQVKNKIELKKRIKTYFCDECDFKTNHKSQLIRHMWTHNREKPMLCPYCSWKCARRYDLTRHMSKAHANAQPFTCNLCDFVTKHKSDLTSHILKKHTSKKNLSCHQCDYKTEKRSNLNRHMKIHGVKIYPCDLCEFKGVESLALSNHVMKVHAGAKPFACDSCHYRSATKGNLNRHMKIHSDEKLYACDLCDYKSALRFVLAKHVKTHKKDAKSK